MKYIKPPPIRIKQYTYTAQSAAILINGIAAFFYSTKLYIILAYEANCYVILSVRALAFTQARAFLFAPIMDKSGNRPRCRSPPAPIRFAITPQIESEENIMQKINLRDLFPDYKLDCYIEVPDSDAEAYAASITKTEADVFIQSERAEAAYLRRLFWNRAHYSLDCGDGLENAALIVPPNPAVLYEQKLMIQQLYKAINNLPDKQAKRLYAHYYLGLSKTEIARIEGVHKMSVTESITRSLRNLKKFLKNIPE